MSEQKIDPGEGFRLLKDDEVLRSDDELVDIIGERRAAWRKTLCSGLKVKDAGYLKNGTRMHFHRRRIAPGEIQCKYCGDWIKAVDGCGKCGTLPPDKAYEVIKRKRQPICTGALDYFPDALAAVAELSFVGNEQHNPGAPMHWDRAKSGDEADALLRHLKDRGQLDTDGIRHTVKVAWRALALLQKELEQDLALPACRASILKTA